MLVEISKERLQVLIDKVYPKTRSTHSRIWTLGASGSLPPDIREHYMYGAHWYLEEKGLITAVERVLLDCRGFVYKMHTTLNNGNRFLLDSEDIVMLERLEEIPDCSEEIDAEEK